ncbi:MAG: DUF3365 domain-containing protein [Polaribacter sp.]|nr:DUF3365 domain-containing protein [Polaribacter sp.]
MIKNVALFIVVSLLISCNISSKKGDKKESKKPTTKEYALIGKQYALSTKKVLGKNLMTAIQKEGTIAALKFCNNNAYSLVDSMSVLYNASIKRVSDKPRNKKNTANAEELKHITSFKTKVLNKQKINPFVKDNGDKVTFYAPIITNGMCLQCHGTLEKELQPTVFSEIKKLYPEDKAVGYAANEVRGIWSITFIKKPK